MKEEYCLEKTHYIKKMNEGGTLFRGRQIYKKTNEGGILFREKR